MGKLKQFYIYVIRGLGRLLAALHILPLIDRHRHIRWCHWFSSLFAIHDLERMLTFDVPWWTYKAIDEVEAFCQANPDIRAFEYGSGASTIWLAKRCQRVDSVEHDAGWYGYLTNSLAEFDNVSLTLVEPDDADQNEPTSYRSGKHGYTDKSFRRYASAIDRTDGQYDLIVIDGRARNACLDHALSRLSARGIVVFDNSWRGRYKPAIAASGLNSTVHTGLTPCLPVPDQTTILRHH